MHYKGLTYLIKASKGLRNADIKFFIAGSGELTEGLKEEGKDDLKVEFFGRITDFERRSSLYASDIVCFPTITRNEGIGLALAGVCILDTQLLPLRSLDQEWTL